MLKRSNQSVQQKIKGIGYKYPINIQSRSGDRSEMLTVLEYMNFTEPIVRDSTFGMEQTNNNIDIDENVLDPPLMESTFLDLCKEANDDYDTEMSLLIDKIIGSKASKPVAKNTLPVLVSTVNV